MTTKAKKEWKAWGGFSAGLLDTWEIDDGFGGFGSGDGRRRSPAIFTSRKIARQRFQDVRPVVIRLAAKRTKKK